MVVMLVVAGITLVATPDPAAAAGPRILILGDSLSAAYNMPTEAGWVALLRERLGEDAVVVNAAISGETTAGARARLPAALDTHDPDVVVIALGGNDGLRGISLAAFRDNLTAMITQARQADAKILLAGVRLPSNYGSAFIERFLGVYEEVANATGVALIPRLLEGVAENRELMQADGIHPNEAAQPIILNTIWSRLETLVVSGEDSAQTG